MNRARAKSRAEPGVETKLACLRDPHTYPRARSVQIIETHMSWVFLTERDAYKLKKPIRLPFVDFTKPTTRWRDAHEEVRLNRRLARDVYLGVVTLTRGVDGRLALGGAGEAIDWIVHMRRLPQTRMLDTLIEKNELAPQDIDPLARRLAEFYRRAPSAGLDGDAYLAQLREALEANYAELRAPDLGLPAERVERVYAEQRRLLEADPPLFAHRAARVVEGHGDLRAEHVCLESPPVVFDCLAFNRRFRLVDPVDELSALGMECERLGAPFVGPELLWVHERVANDRPSPPLLDFYRASRACLRAKLAILHVREVPAERHAQWRGRANDYLRLATTYSRRIAAMG